MTTVLDWLAGGSFFEHKGHRIFWREGGDPNAPVLLLIHGFPAASWDWDKVWPDLVVRYRVITLDMIGFGFSDKPYFYDYRTMDQADIYDELLELKGVKEFHLFAHGYGVSVAAELIARDSTGAGRAKLLSVVLLSGGLFPETRPLVFLQALLLSPIGPLMSLLTSKKVISEHMRNIFGKYYPPDQETLDGIWTLIQYNHGDRIMHKLIHSIPDCIEHRERWVGAIQNIKVPVKLIDGMADPVFGAQKVVHYRELVPNADVTELSQAGHYPQVQVPYEVLQAFFQFHELLDNRDAASQSGLTSPTPH